MNNPDVQVGKLQNTLDKKFAEVTPSPSGASSGAKQKKQREGNLKLLD